MRTGSISGVVPTIGKALVTDYPEFENRFTPWLGVVLATAIPCYAVLVFAWLVSVNIGRENAFCRKNALYFRIISVLAACDSVFFLIANIILYLLNMSHPSVALLSLVVVFFGICVTVCSSVLSYLVDRAATLQEESELTI